MDMDELLELYRSVRGVPAESFLELAAGPAPYALEAARRGLRAVALGDSARMRDRALDRAAEERVYLDYRLGDSAPRCDLGVLFGGPAVVAELDVDVLVTDSLEACPGYRLERRVGERSVWVRA